MKLYIMSDTIAVVKAHCAERKRRWESVVQEKGIKPFCKAGFAALVVIFIQEYYNTETA